MKFKRENTTLHDIFMQGRHGQWKPYMYVGMGSEEITRESINDTLDRYRGYVEFFKDDESLERLYKEGFITFHKDGFVLWEHDFSH